MSPVPGTRDLRIDVVRGLALVSMYVAHCSPVGGPLVLSEYLTYPLFAALIGAGAQLARRRLTGPGSRWTWWSVAVRGGVLVGVGLLLEHAGVQVVIVLVYLGLLTWVTAPLARAPTSVVAVIGLASYVLAPIVHDALVDDRLQLLVEGRTTRLRLLDLLVSGEYYRVSSMIFFAAVGILLTRLLLHRSTTTQLRIGVPVGLVAAGCLALSRAGVFTLEPYDATHAEHLFDALLVVSVLLIGVAVGSLAPRATVAMAWVGQMALTLYALQICWLALDVRSLHPGQRDDSWANVVILVVGSVALASGWRLIVKRGSWSRGPLEGATSLLAGGLRRPDRVDTTEGRRHRART